jgi:hypothetical protein
MNSKYNKTLEGEICTWQLKNIENIGNLESWSSQEFKTEVFWAAELRRRVLLSEVYISSSIKGANLKSFATQNPSFSFLSDTLLPLRHNEITEYARHDI